MYSSQAKQRNNAKYLDLIFDIWSSRLWMINWIHYRNGWGQFCYCFWTWMMAFFYSAYSVILPIFVRKVFGKTNFVANIGFLWLSYPVGSVLITVLVKALFATIHFSGFSVSIAFCHMISFYAAYSMKKAHKNYLLKSICSNYISSFADSNDRL